MLLGLLLSCATDVSILKVNEPEDSSVVSLDSSDPPSSDRVGVTGYNYLHLRQVACTACMG